VDCWFRADSGSTVKQAGTKPVMERAEVIQMTVAVIVILVGVIQGRRIF
jgi:hypothetical protein